MYDTAKTQVIYLDEREDALTEEAIEQEVGCPIPLTGDTVWLGGSTANYGPWIVSRREFAYFVKTHDERDNCGVRVRIHLSRSK